MEDNVVSFPNKVVPFKTNKTAVVIPARLGSSRLPNKMLKEVFPGVTLIEHVYNLCCACHNPDDVFVATDSFEIMDLFPGSSFMTSVDCQNGTERVAEARTKIPYYDYIINVQGDMVEFDHTIIQTVQSYLENGVGDVVTVVKEMDEKDRHNPSTVKCIHNDDVAHWFCRAPLEYGDWHLGIYGYTRDALRHYTFFEKFKEEEIESLEQLRWLQNFYNIGIIWAHGDASEINTQEDLDNWLAQIQSN